MCLYTVYLLELCSPNIHVEVLAPRTSERDLVWTEGLYRGYEVKMRSLEWASIQYKWCPYNKGKLGRTHVPVKEGPGEDIRRRQPSTSQGERPQKKSPPNSKTQPC